MTDELLQIAEALFAAWAADQRLPAVAWSQARRYWGAGFAAGVDAALCSLEDDGQDHP